MTNEMSKRIAILGGYGNTGSNVATLLGQLGGFDITIFGRDGDRANILAETISKKTGSLVRGKQVDVRNYADLRNKLANTDIVLSTTSATEYASAVARVALELGCDYMDAHLSSPMKWAELRKIESQIAERGLCFISDGGTHPGLPVTLVRLVASEISIRTASVYGSFSIDWAGLKFSSNASDDFIGELRDMDPSIFVDGNWRSSWRNLRNHNFGEMVGIQDCVAMNLEEMRRLPLLFPTLCETGFFVGSFGKTIDLLVMPICLFGLKIIPTQANRIGRFLLFALKHWALRGQWAILDLVATGQQDGRETQIAVRVSHKDAYELTALTIVATLIQYRIQPRREGLWTQAEYLHPKDCLDFLKANGVGVEINSDLS